MMMSMLTPNQKQAANIFQGKNTQEQAQEIANYCNQNGISKDQLQQIIKMFSKR
jgi:hypothetical protein